MLKPKFALFGISSLLMLQFIVLLQAYALEEFETVEVGSSPIQITLNPNTNTIYVTNQANSILAIDGFDNKIIDTINIGTFPRGIAVNSVTNTIYVTNPLDGTVSVIDGSNNKVVDSIIVESLPRGIAVNAVTNTIYVTHPSDNKLSLIDGSNNKVVDSIIVESLPRGIAVNSVTNTIYVTNPLDGTVSVIDGSNNKVVDSIIVDDGSFGIAVNEATNTVYTVSCFNEISAVSVIDGSTNTLKDPLLIEDCAWTVAVNPQTNSVYVANPTLNSIFVFDEIATESEMKIPSEPAILSRPKTSEITTEPVLTKKIATSEIPTTTQLTENPAQNYLDMFAFLGLVIAAVIVGVITIKNRNKGKLDLIKNNEFKDSPEKNSYKKKNLISQKLQNKFSNPQTEIVRGIDPIPMIENKIQMILNLERYHIGDKVRLDEIKNSLLSDGSFSKKDNDYIEIQYEQYKKIALISD